MKKSRCISWTGKYGIFSYCPCS